MIKCILIKLLVFFLIIPVILGIGEFFGGTKYIHTPEIKNKLLISHKKLIEEGNVIQGFPNNGWSVSYYPLSNRDWFYPKIYDYFYKWSVYYRFKWFDRC